MEIIKEIKINRIVPARAWYYMYAYTNEGNYFIYAHRDRVSFFANHKAENISNFQDTVTKLTTVKWFNEKTEKNAAKIEEIDFDKSPDKKLKFGTCLITKDIMENFKAEVWIDNKEKEVLLKLFDAGDFKHKLDSDIVLPDPEEDKRLTAKKERFEEAKKTNNSKLVDLIYDQPKFFKLLFSFGSFGYPFTQKELLRFQSIIDWSELSLNQQIKWTNEIIGNFSDKFDWEKLCSNKSIHWNTKRVEKFDQKINWKGISKNESIDWTELVDHYEENLDWKDLASNPTFPWTEENIRKYSKRLYDWKGILRNPNAEFNSKILTEYKDKIDFFFLCQNEGDFWNEELIEQYKEDLNWKWLSKNPALPWSLSFIQHHSDYIDWIELSKNPQVPWSEYLLETYEDELAFGWLSKNSGLPWSMELIEKYSEEWNWSNLGSNSGIPWTEIFIEENLEKFKNYNGTWSLWSNEGLPQNEDFWIKHKDILFPKHKGSGLSRVIDASNNDSLPISVDLLYELKENLDWNVYLFRMLKRTGKFKELLSKFDEKIISLILETDHFER